MTYMKRNTKFSLDRRITGKIDAVELAKLLAACKKVTGVCTPPPPLKPAS